MSHRLWLVVDKEVRAAEYELDAQVWHNQAPTTGEQVDGPRVFAGAPGGSRATTEWALQYRRPGSACAAPAVVAA
jgi:hypothetical protein